MGCDKTCKCHENVIDFLCPRYDHLWENAQKIRRDAYIDEIAKKEEKIRQAKDRKQQNELVKKNYRLPYEGL